MTECQHYSCEKEAELGLILMRETEEQKHYGEYCKEHYQELDKLIERKTYCMRNSDARPVMEWVDHLHDVAYLSLKQIQENEIKVSQPVRDSSLVLDFNEDGELVGIETYAASKDLPDEVLDRF